MSRYSLRTLLILLAIGPPVGAAAWIYRIFWLGPLVIAFIVTTVAVPLGFVLAFAMNTAIAVSRLFQK